MVAMKLLNHEIRFGFEALGIVTTRPDGSKRCILAQLWPVGPRLVVWTEPKEAA